MQQRFSQGISELVLIVSDVSIAARFYRDVLLLVPDGEADETWAWFWTGEPEHSARLALTSGTLLFAENSPHPKNKRFGHVHYAMFVQRDQLLHAVDHVRKAGVEVHGPVQLNWMNAASYYFYDPDGNLLEFWSPDGSSLFADHDPQNDQQ